MLCHTRGSSRTHAPGPAGARTLHGRPLSIAPAHRRAPLRVAAALVTVLVALGPATTAAAATVAPDAETAVRDIVFPVDGTSTYSDTFGACRSGCTRAHAGIDIMTAKLTPLLAATDATVTSLKGTATPDGSAGNYLILEDSAGWEYWYIHVNNDSPGTDDGANPEEWVFGPGVAQGAAVEAGQVVAYAGDSGNAEASSPHLHFEIHKPDGSVINPYRSLQAAEDGADPSPQYVTSPEHERFVRALSVDFLDRPATDDEVARHAGAMARGESRASVVAAYAESDEWVSALVSGYYESTLGRPADEEGLRYWIAQIAGGMTPADVASHFYGSSEYFTASGDSEAWVTDLYREIVRREPDEGGLAHWSGQADEGVPLAAIASSFYASMESRQTRVTGLYDALLDRAPDPSGLAHWSDRLADGRDIALAVVLAVSPEYHERAQQRSDLG